MFYYYGRKKQIAKYYPKPTFDTIIEPFAGSAAYSLHGSNWKKNVILVEKDERVYAIWDWLIKRATSDEISQMPDLVVGEKTSNFLHIVHAATKMAFQYKTIKVTPVLARNWEISKRNMAFNLHKIKHWKIILGDYTRAPNLRATWFVDPPYRGDSGNGYDHGSELIDYGRLASWVYERQGEVICCEGMGADYLPFEPLLMLMGIAGKRSMEMIYYRSSRALKQSQLPFVELALPTKKKDFAYTKSP